MRKVHIGATNTPWRYKVYKSGTVVVYPPAGKKIVIKGWTLKGLTPDTFERGCWKRSSDGTVFPSEIKKYLEDHY